jgi:hypothetical protein
MLDTPNRQNTRLFHGWRVALTDTARVYVANVADHLLSWESEHHPRTRKRKFDDLAQFNAQVQALVCDLIHQQLTNPGEFIGVTLRDLDVADRYRAPVLTKSIRHVIQLMEAASYIGVVKGHNRDGWRNSVSTSIWFKPGDHGVTLTDIGEAVGELIYLREYREYSDPEITGKKPVKLPAANKQYVDTRDTRKWRQTMSELYEWLRLSDISVVSDTIDDDDDGDVVDANQRALYRIFTDKFTQGGRMYGGFWINMSKEERFKSIRMDGKRVVEVDYKQAHPTILYGQAGASVPDDSYELPGVPKEYREDVKALFNAMLNARQPLRRYPDGVDRIGQLSCPKAVKLIRERHAAIADKFQTGIGLRLQRTESDIMVAVLLRLKEMGIVALPIHDALLVADGNEQTAKEMMLEVFRKQLGFESKVELRVQ